MDFHLLVLAKVRWKIILVLPERFLLEMGSMNILVVNLRAEHIIDVLLSSKR